MDLDMVKHSENKKPNWPENVKEVKQRNNENIFDYFFSIIIKYKNTKIYKFIYSHPRFAINILIFIGLVIIMMFVKILIRLYNIAN